MTKIKDMDDETFVAFIMESYEEFKKTHKNTGILGINIPRWEKKKKGGSR